MSTSDASAAAFRPTLSRPRHGRMIAGVCAGIARRFGWDPTVVRIVAAVSILLPGPQVIAYLVLWALMPNDRD
ncbi:PspC domain-containing protein [Cellulosimicrobium cellulans]|jgi:phage shock protein PspC (stress-responsive transcriptional regulator)|uniref:PspC domain-containing protein n=1 Tax=Cellulosimicrobium TaxID=157920 RepID=UPI000884EB0E|nr:PspC domain-containing protein [Sphaerisporangium cinnabarinum]MCR1982308.1 PspC domain-containing protein [Cellulosimicrobium cellulans]PTU57440.1 PspC domain-containing protein [Sphaerisporangium cinnabarinum]SDF14666.1 phage shock protein C (PspC) family protein [Cellulosimicrobium cellulans]